MRTLAYVLAPLLLGAACAKTSPSAGRATAGQTSTPSAETPCPKDELAARGTVCAPEGKTCGTSPSGFTHFVMCSQGKWTEMDAPPPPPPPPPPVT